VHILSQQHYEECSRSVQLVRICLAHGESGLEPTLIIKSTSLALKYLIRLGQIELKIARLKNGAIVYFLTIQDDPVHPLTLWSLVETPNELKALADASLGRGCWVHVFNEAIVNVSSAQVAFDCVGPEHGAVTAPALASADSEHLREEVELLLDDVYRGLRPATILRTTTNTDWRTIQSTYITNDLSTATLSIMNCSEGDQQEVLAVWLVDWLVPKGVTRSPQVKDTKGSRELCDVFLSYEHGSFLIESKTLSILDRTEIPDRERLRKTTLKSLTKACSQLRGAWRRVQTGSQIVTLNGDQVSADTKQPAHAIVLVPDLSLLAEVQEAGGTFVARFGQDCQAMLHILDPAHLIELARNARYLSEHSRESTPLMAFDALLVGRWKKALTLSTAHFNFGIRIDTEN